MKGLTIEQRFWAKVQKADGCWIWTGARHSIEGHGHMKIEGKSIGAHRLSYQIAFGSIPPGLFVCHQCDNPPCVNPAHLFLGTNQDNLADMLAKGRQNRRFPQIFRGDLHGRAKLTSSNVLAIRQEWNAGTTSVTQFANLYGVSRGAINHVLRGNTWRHV
jgi:hypothetical protein